MLAFAQTGLADGEMEAEHLKLFKQEEETTAHSDVISFLYAGFMQWTVRHHKKIGIFPAHPGQKSSGSGKSSTKLHQGSMFVMSAGEPSSH